MLIVDDHGPTRTVLGRILSLRGWEVAEAGTVAEALALFQPIPDCLILDLSLPDGDGEEILKALPALTDGAGRLNTIVISGISDAERLKSVERSFRPTAVFSKPVAPEEVFRICDQSRNGGQEA
jgi:CheY-like chemotaxis protein